MESLFTAKEQQALTELQQHKSEIRCQTCDSCIRKQYGSAAFFYCRERKSKQTGNGYQKIKARQNACPLHQYFKTTPNPEKK